MWNLLITLPKSPPTHDLILIWNIYVIRSLQQNLGVCSIYSSSHRQANMFQSSVSCRLPLFRSRFWVWKISGSLNFLYTLTKSPLSLHLSWRCNVQHTSAQYSVWGLTYILYMFLKVFGLLDLKHHLNLLIFMIAFFQVLITCAKNLQLSEKSQNLGPYIEFLVAATYFPCNSPA